MSYKNNFNRHRQYFHSSPGFESEKWTLVPLSERWIMLGKALRLAQRKEFFELNAFVMMSTHFHMLFSVTDARENFVIEAVHQQIKVLLELPHDQQALELPLLAEPITSYQQLLYTYRYIYRNPVEAGLTEKTEQYSFSSLRELIGKQPYVVGAMDPVSLIQFPQRILRWLNDAEDGRLYRSL